MRFRNVLLIDDDEEDAEIFCAAAKEASGTVQCVVSNDATEALEKLDSQSINPDVIFLDLNMPIMSGQKFLYELKTRDTLKEIPVIVFSTTAEASTILQTQHLGASDFITKPDRFDELVDVLSRLFGK